MWGGTGGIFYIFTKFCNKLMLPKQRQISIKRNCNVFCIPNEKTYLKNRFERNKILFLYSVEPVFLKDFFSWNKFGSFLDSHYFKLFDKFLMKQSRLDNVSSRISRSLLVLYLRLKVFNWDIKRSDCCCCVVVAEAVGAVL